jgi:hypothetical protein
MRVFLRVEMNLVDEVAKLLCFDVNCCQVEPDMLDDETMELIQCTLHIPSGVKRFSAGFGATSGRSPTGPVSRSLCRVEYDKFVFSSC